MQPERAESVVMCRHKDRACATTITGLGLGMGVPGNYRWSTNMPLWLVTGFAVGKCGGSKVIQVYQFR